MQLLANDTRSTLTLALKRNNTVGDRLYNTLDPDLPIECSGHSLSGAACVCLANQNGCPDLGIQHDPRFTLVNVFDPSTGWVVEAASLQGMDVLYNALTTYNSAGIMQEWRVRNSNQNNVLNSVSIAYETSHQCGEMQITALSILSVKYGYVASAFGWAITGQWATFYSTIAPYNNYLFGHEPQNLQRLFNTQLDLNQRLDTHLRLGAHSLRQAFKPRNIYPVQAEKGWQTVYLSMPGGNVLVTDLNSVNPPAPGQPSTAQAENRGVKIYDYGYSSSLADTSSPAGALSDSAAFEGSSPVRINNIEPGWKAWLKNITKPNGNWAFVPYQPTLLELGEA